MEAFSDFRAPLYEVKANLFKGLAHPVRIRVLELLSAAPEVSVTEMLAATGLEASHLSQHLMGPLARCSALLHRSCEWVRVSKVATAFLSRSMARDLQESIIEMSRPRRR